ncbi:MAG: nicotinamide riboside transporter PnuC [Flavobacteriaceae bacterium]|nr:nicotinamide riboside transporter PnuC [Flavobacteriaceae bacterium]
MELIDFILAQYKTYPKALIFLEMTAVALGFYSVWLQKQNNRWLFPIGMLSTGIFVYILLKFNLLGDAIINAYYFIASIYGWVFWSSGNSRLNRIQNTSNKEWYIAGTIASISALLVSFFYHTTDRWEYGYSIWDIVTTAIFFAAMWLLARRRVEHWLLWIVGNSISVPLYLFKGLFFTAVQYVGFLILAIWGFYAWKKQMNK